MLFMAHYDLYTHPNGRQADNSSINTAGAQTVFVSLPTLYTLSVSLQLLFARAQVIHTLAVC